MRTLILRASPVNFHTQSLYTAIPSTRLQSTPSQSQLRNCSQNAQLPPIIQNHLPALEDVVTYDNPLHTSHTEVYGFGAEETTRPEDYGKSRGIDGRFRVGNADSDAVVARSPFVLDKVWYDHELQRF